MTSSKSRASAEARLYVLDGLRLMAALMVVAWHLVAGNASRAWETSTADLFTPIHYLSRHGWLGVELFFLISGFVICMSSWGRTLGGFAVSRFARLFPGYWAAVIITTVVLVVAPIYQQPLSGLDTLANLTMVQELMGIPYLDLSYWTLLVELIFYALFAVVVAFGVTYRRVILFCLIWTAAALVVPGFGNGHLTLVFGARYAPYFIAGVAFYLIYRFRSSAVLWGLVGMSWLLAMVRLRTEFLSYSGAEYRASAILVTGFFVIMAAVALGLFGWVTWRWVATAGALTYPLYLLHQVIGLTVIKAFHAHLPPWVLLGVVVAGLLLAAWIVYRYVEKPGSRLLKRLLGQPAPGSTPTRVEMAAPLQRPDDGAVSQQSAAEVGPPDRAPAHRS